MSNATETTTKPTLLEAAAAETRIALNTGSAVGRGWKAITPEVIEALNESDVKRTDDLTAHYMARFS